MTGFAATLSAEDRERMAEVDQLAGAGPSAAEALIGRLADPSWAIRRAVVGALARLGEPAVGPLIDALRDRRDSEARIAATVDALVASTGAPEDRLVAVGQVEPRPEVLCDVIQVLGRRGAAACADALAGWARHPDDNVAVRAIEALGNIGGGAGLEALTEAAGGRSFFRVFPAVDVLGRTPDPRALEPLRGLLADPVWGLEAARALGRRREADAVPALVGLLSSGVDAMVRVAAVALCEIAERHQEQFGSAAAVSAEVRRATPDPAGTARRLAHSVGGADTTERAAFARLLGWLGEAGASEALIGLLGDDARVSRDAARALADLGPVAEREILTALVHGDSERRLLLLAHLPLRPEVADAVTSCLSDVDPRVRSTACEVLARAGAVAAVPRLFDVLADEDPRVAQAALQAVQALGSERTEPLALAAARGAEPRVRRAAIRILGYFGWPSALEPLLAAVEDPDGRLRDAALSSLAYLEDPRALEGLLVVARRGEPGARAAAMRALGSTEPLPAVLACLEAGTADPHAWTRYFACQSLGRLGAAGSIAALVGRLSDEAGQVRIAVVDALARLPDPRATRALLDAAASGDLDLRCAALVALGIARPPAGLPVLLEAAREPLEATRVIALSAVAGYDDPGVDRVLAESAGSPEEPVRAAAIGALAGRRGVPSTLLLVELLADPSSRTRALDALSTFVTGRIPGVLAALETAEPAVVQPLVAALARMKRPEARAALGVVLAMDRVEARRSAAAAYAAAGAGASRSALEQAAETDPDPEVRRLASHALARS